MLRHVLGFGALARRVLSPRFYSQIVKTESEGALTIQPMSETDAAPYYIKLEKIDPEKLTDLSDRLKKLGLTVVHDHRPGTLGVAIDPVLFQRLVGGVAANALKNPSIKFKPSISIEGHLTNRPK